ncbi:hypothetical protein M9H77_10934 [Catharanthus roseus]|uniref:Uncharacterized protein n=1 Tax=Catharanthus roseus TaxID=4058 RepID=A0ACC0BD63_CATRO|nr:hypothetical protein M9H77_10934 [Catharanthus roseus]
MRVRLFGNRAIVWCLAGIDYKMSKLDFDDPISGFEPCPWSPTVALHVSLNSGVEAALMTYSLVSRDTQIRYSPAVDLVAGLGVSHVVSEHLGLLLGVNCWGLDKL